MGVVTRAVTAGVAGGSEHSMLTSTTQARGLPPRPVPDRVREGLPLEARWAHVGAVAQASSWMNL